MEHHLFSNQCLNQTPRCLLYYLIHQLTSSIIKINIEQNKAWGVMWIEYMLMILFFMWENIFWKMEIPFVEFV